MTTTQNPAPAQPVTTCPPSDVHDMIVRWSEVQAGETVLYGGHVRRLVRMWPLMVAAMPEMVGVRLMYGGRTIDVAVDSNSYTAVRRYTEGEPPGVERLRAELAQQLQATRDVDDLRMAEIGQLRSELDRLRSLAAPAFDEAAADRDHRAEIHCFDCTWTGEGPCPDQREHAQRAGEYRQARDELLEACRG